MQQQQRQTDINTKANLIYPKRDKLNINDRVRIKKQFLIDTLDQPTMQKISGYLRKNQSKYANFIFKNTSYYTIYQELLLLQKLKQCQIIILDNKMMVLLSLLKLKNSQRAQTSIGMHLITMQKTFDKEKIQALCNSSLQIKQNYQNASQIKVFINKILDYDIILAINKYVQKHETYLDYIIEKKKNYKRKRFNLLQDCIILRSLKQKTSKCTIYQIFKCLKQKLKRHQDSIYHRVQFLISFLNKQKIAFFIEKNFQIYKPKQPYVTREIINSINISFNQIILRDIEQQTNKILKGQNMRDKKIVFLQRLVIIFYIKKYFGKISFPQICQIISTKIHKTSRQIQIQLKAFLQRIRDCSLNGDTQWIYQYFRTNNIHPNLLADQMDNIQNGYSQLKEQKIRNGISENNSFQLGINNSDVDTLINMLNQSRFLEEEGSMIKIFKELKSSISKESSRFLNETFSIQLLYQGEQTQSNQQQKNKVSIFDEVLPKKDKKAQKRKNKAQQLKERRMYLQQLQQIQDKVKLSESMIMKENSSLILEVEFLEQNVKFDGDTVHGEQGQIIEVKLQEF